MRVLVGGLAQGALVEPDGLRDPLQRLVHRVGLGVQRSTTSRKRATAAPPHTDGGTALICPMNVLGIGLIVSPTG